MATKAPPRAQGAQSERSRGDGALEPNGGGPRALAAQASWGTRPRNHPKTGWRARCRRRRGKRPRAALALPGGPNRRHHARRRRGKSDEDQVSGPTPRRGPPAFVPERTIPDATRERDRPSAPVGDCVQKVQGGKDGTDSPAARRPIGPHLIDVSSSLIVRPGPEGRTLPGREGCAGRKGGPRARTTERRPDRRKTRRGRRPGCWVGDWLVHKPTLNA